MGVLNKLAWFCPHCLYSRRRTQLANMSKTAMQCCGPLSKG